MGEKSCTYASKLFYLIRTLFIQTYYEEKLQCNLISDLKHTFENYTKGFQEETCHCKSKSKTDLKQAPFIKNSPLYISANLSNFEEYNKFASNMQVRNLMEINEFLTEELQIRNTSQFEAEILCKFNALSFINSNREFFMKDSILEPFNQEDCALSVENVDELEVFDTAEQCENMELISRYRLIPTKCQSNQTSKFLFKGFEMECIVCNIASDRHGARQLLKLKKIIDSNSRQYGSHLTSTIEALSKLFKNDRNFLLESPCNFQCKQNFLEFLNESETYNIFAVHFFQNPLCICYSRTVNSDIQEKILNIITVNSSIKRAFAFGACFCLADFLLSQLLELLSLLRKPCQCK